MRIQIGLDKIFCCPGFQHRITDAGQRGIAVIVIRTSDGIRFRLQSRGIAFEDERKIRPVPDSPEIKINIAEECGLQYCPFCGRRLQELVEASPRPFEELVEKHKKFSIAPKT